MDYRLYSRLCSCLSRVFGGEISFSLGYPTLYSLLTTLVQWLKRYYGIESVTMYSKDKELVCVLERVCRENHLYMDQNSSGNGLKSLLVIDKDYPSDLITCTRGYVYKVLYIDSLARDSLSIASSLYPYIDSIITGVYSLSANRYRYIVFAKGYERVKKLPGIFVVCSRGYTLYKHCCVRNEYSRQIVCIMDYSVVESLYKMVCGVV